jgi:cell fate (sporulation/competence/biofilm development) regulator YlbF (YheA/YmcA/DUF963 family)
MELMEKELVDALGELKLALASDPRVKKLDALEKKVMEDPSVLALSQEKENAVNAYQEILSYHKENDPEALLLQKKLYEAKKALDENPLVQEYNAAYIVVRDLYMTIDDILYKDFRRPQLTEGEKA